MNRPLEVYIRYRAFVGIISLIAVLYLSNPSAVSIGIGFFFIVFGMSFRAWSAGYISKNRELATKGPYELTRNPLYFGNFLLGMGIAIGGNNIYTYVIFIVYYFFLPPQ